MANKTGNIVEPVPFEPGLMLHGGNPQGSELPPELLAARHASLQSYLRSTHALLRNGSTALEAAVHVISLLEDDPLFNCGRGSAFTAAGTVEMKATIMVTSLQPAARNAINRGAGVTGVRNVRHPIHLAQEALKRMAIAGSPVDELGHMHTELAGPEVETLARDCGVEFCPDKWFFTQKRWDEHIAGLDGVKVPISLDEEKVPISLDQKKVPVFVDPTAEPAPLDQDTVGCTCADLWGNFVVATSSGGVVNRLPWKFDDMPLIGRRYWSMAYTAISDDGERVLEDSSVGGLLRDATNWLWDRVPRFWRSEITPNYSPFRVIYLPDSRTQRMGSVLVIVENLISMRMWMSTNVFRR
ncbi:hypothetical protein N7517_001616 [Penicillium concentricum]|uniref:Uncharacterized protein n=1 Tax=Penicillium concentricum TaxID=293559 RepID=A0A9W9SSD7_9EURO|nr:uncharacterized protein N7517_001616 [Penicillium concentricum]KAJ5383705.1 hypothetical protein N7517_001616 [Penicillium concentricum]